MSDRSHALSFMPAPVQTVLKGWLPGARIAMPLSPRLRSAVRDAAERTGGMLPAACGLVSFRCDPRVDERTMAAAVELTKAPWESLHCAVEFVPAVPGHATSGYCDHHGVLVVQVDGRDHALKVAAALARAAAYAFDEQHLTDAERERLQALVKAGRWRTHSLQDAVAEAFADVFVRCCLAGTGYRPVSYTNLPSRAFEDAVRHIYAAAFRNGTVSG